MNMPVYEYQFKPCGTISEGLMGIGTDEPIKDCKVSIK